MKMLDRLTHSILRRVAVVSPLVSYQETALPVNAVLADVNRYAFELTLRAEITGRPDDLPEIRRRALRMLSHELYGEVADEVNQVLRDLYTENTYRAPNDPVSSRLSDLAHKLRNGGL